MCGYSVSPHTHTHICIHTHTHTHTHMDVLWHQGDPPMKSWIKKTKSKWKYIIQTIMIILCYPALEDEMVLLPQIWLSQMHSVALLRNSAMHSLFLVGDNLPPSLLPGFPQRSSKIKHHFSSFCRLLFVYFLGGWKLEGVSQYKQPHMFFCHILKLTQLWHTITGFHCDDVGEAYWPLSVSFHPQVRPLAFIINGEGPPVWKKMFTHRGCERSSLLLLLLLPFSLLLLCFQRALPPSLDPGRGAGGCEWRGWGCGCFEILPDPSLVLWKKLWGPTQSQRVGGGGGVMENSSSYSLGVDGWRQDWGNISKDYVYSNNTK